MSSTTPIYMSFKFYDELAYRCIKVPFESMIHNILSDAIAVLMSSATFMSS